MVDTPIALLPRTKPQTIKLLQNLGINTYGDLLNHIPFRYENYSVISSIGSIQEGETVTLQGVIEKIDQIYTRSRLRIQKATLSDTTGQIELIWYNQPFLTQMLKKGMRISVAGEVKRFKDQISMTPNEYEVVRESGETLHSGRYVPVYPETRGISSRTIREKVWYVLHQENNEIGEWLPSEIVKSNKLLNENTAYRMVHFPRDEKEIDQARERIGFDEFFTVQLAANLIKTEWEKEVVGNIFKMDKKSKKKITDFIKQLPFTLTKGQKKAIDEILTDLGKQKPMNRFLQGDVGSGKTVVAAIAAYFSFLNGFQTLYMAPTEILAQQHFQTFQRLFKNTSVKIGLQTGSKKDVKKTDRKEKVKFDIIIGTQALLHSSLITAKIGFVIIDEQHRFGVAQRALLKQKGLNPHLLTMTATPIPRTVALTLYGELDMSVLDEMPVGRIPIKTWVVPHTKRANAYEWIKSQMKEYKTQTFIICPLIEESEEETLKSVKAAKAEFDHLKNDVFKDWTVGLLHGKLKPIEKADVMLQFNNKHLDILVATPVVEVGIDVPNATIMIIEGPERFGLAQLHQLRGRVGRGDKQSYCILFSDTAESNSRLQFFAKTESGMKLAEFDLKIRGSGDLYGLRQHGYTDLKVASFSNYPLLESSKQAVHHFTSTYNIKEFPEVLKRINRFRVGQIAHD